MGRESDFELCTCRRTMQANALDLWVHTGNGLGVSAYRRVGVAVRNRQNQLRPPSPLRPVVPRRARVNGLGCVLFHRARATVHSFALYDGQLAMAFGIAA